MKAFLQLKTAIAALDNSAVKCQRAHHEVEAYQILYADKNREAREKEKAQCAQENRTLGVQDYRRIAGDLLKDEPDEVRAKVTEWVKVQRALNKKSNSVPEEEISANPLLLQR